MVERLEGRFDRRAREDLETLAAEMAIECDED